MEFYDVVGSRRSIRYFEPEVPVGEPAVQRILEAARLVSCPGNTQPWRAVVVVAAELAEGDREALLSAGNRQWPQVLAPVWVYWFADPDAVTSRSFVDRVVELLPTGAAPAAFGWSERAVREIVEEGAPAPQGLPPLDAILHVMPPGLSAVLAVQETNGACQVAQLAAVAEGLGTCLLSVSHPARLDEVRRILAVPEDFLPVWLQLLGHPAESPEAGGQRPRDPFEETFARGRWGTPFVRDPGVVDELRRRRLVQEPAPLAGRFDELDQLARRFGISDKEAR